MGDTVLLIDDEEQVIRSLRRSLMEEDYEILSANDGETGLALLDEHEVKVVICDERMPGLSGSEVLARISLRHPQTVRIMLTGQATLEAAMQAVNSGEIYRFFLKPWDDVEVRLSIRSGIEKYDLEEQNRRLLALVRTQDMRLQGLEKRYPGISRSGRGEDGSYEVPELSAEEEARLLAECRIEPPSR